MAKRKTKPPEEPSEDLANKTRANFFMVGDFVRYCFDIVTNPSTGAKEQLKEQRISSEYIGKIEEIHPTVCMVRWKMSNGNWWKDTQEWGPESLRLCTESGELLEEVKNGR